MIVDLNEIRLNYVNEADNINFFCCLTTKSPVIVLSNEVIVIITASLLQAMGSTGAFRSGYCFRVTWFPQALADLPCIAGFDVSVSNCRHPRLRYFGSVVPVYVVWVKSYVNCLFHFPCVPMVVSVNRSRLLVIYIAVPEPLSPSPKEDLQ